jgi:hypothetical protein
VQQTHLSFVLYLNLKTKNTMNQNITIKQLKNANTIEDLQDLGIGRVQYEIGHRGGYVGFYATSVSEALSIPEWQLTGKVGAYVNYLGGGLRGSVGTSEYGRVEGKRKIRLVEELLEACRRAYINAENEIGLNDEEDGDGDTNWDALATAKVREAGVTRAY